MEICQRLFNFMINSSIGQSLKRLTLGHSPPSDHEMDGLLIEIEGPSSANEEKLNRKYDFEPEIAVEFNHENGVEKWTHYDHHKKKNEIKENLQGEKGILKNKKKGKEIAIPKKQILYEEREEDHRMSPRRFFLNNINEKSEAFIRQKREALRKSMSLDKF